MMVTLEEIAKRLKKADKKTDEKSFDYRPVKCIDFKLPDFDVKESSAPGAKKKLAKKLGLILSFIDSVKQFRYKEGCTIMSISCTSKTNLDIYGSSMNVSNSIKYMKQIGLISDEVSTYQFNSDGGYFNKGKTYRYYKTNEDKLLTYCKKNNIKKCLNVCDNVDNNKSVGNKGGNNDGGNGCNHTIVKSCKNELLMREKIRFGSNLMLKKPESLTKEQFEEYIDGVLHEKYIGLKFYQDKVDEINKRFYKEYRDFRLKFKPRITWNENKTMVTKIGIRLTNKFCSLKKKKRNNVLINNNFTYIYDVCSSVPRVTYALNSGEFNFKTKDFYKKIFRILEPKGKITIRKRDAIKSLFMRSYFELSDETQINHIWRKIKADDINKNDVNDVMSNFRHAVIKAVGGNTFGSDIFYVESCVYLMTLYDLLTSGSLVWIVYDCFYCTKRTESKSIFYRDVEHGLQLNFKDFIQYHL